MIKFNHHKDINYGIIVENFNIADSTESEIKLIKETLYKEKLILFKNQTINAEEFLYFGKKIGNIKEYYEKMYHHRTYKEIFVSSNITENGEMPEGIPRTGSFWHSDYAFTKHPFALTITYPYVVPANRGIYFIDMGKVYAKLKNEVKELIENSYCQHSVRKYFKIRPQDVHRPLNAILQEIEETNPTTTHPTIIIHPVTGEKILYISEGYTLSMQNIASSEDNSTILQMLLEFSGQLDKSYTHESIKMLKIEQGDLILWDNRQLIHHAKHPLTDEPSKTYRLTVYDELPFSKTAT